MTQRYEFPDRGRANDAYTHKLEDLLKLAGLRDTLKVAEAAVQAAWATTIHWKIDDRYRVGRPEVEVLDFLNAVAGRRGVLRWLRQFW
jgi:hypothetical protein